jgi:hypothetical protein
MRRGPHHLRFQRPLGTKLRLASWRFNRASSVFVTSSSPWILGSGSMCRSIATSRPRAIISNPRCHRSLPLSNANSPAVYHYPCSMSAPPQGSRQHASGCESTLRHPGLDLSGPLCSLLQSAVRSTALIHPPLPCVCCLCARTYLPSCLVPTLSPGHSKCSQRSRCNLLRCLLAKFAILTSPAPL